MASLLTSSSSSLSEETKKELLEQIRDLALGDSQLESLKFVCRALDITQQQIDKSSLCDLYNLIVNRNENEAPSLMYALLLRIDCVQWQLVKVDRFKTIHDEKPYDINTVNSQLDLRLTLADIAREMSDEKYEQFKQLVCHSSYLNHMYHPDNINSRCHLLQVLLDKENPPNFGLILNWLEACNCGLKFKSIIFDYCKRQGLPTPEPIVITDNGLQVSEAPAVSRKIKCPCRCSRKCVIFHIVVILIFFGFQAGFVSVQLPRFMNLNLNPVSHYYGASSTVFLDSFGASTTKKVIIHTNQSILVHRILSNDNNNNNTRTVVLNNKPVIPLDNGFIYSDNRSIYVNYYDENKPLYTADLGHITYWIDLISYGEDTPCPLQLVAFTSHSLFHQFLSPPYPSKVPPGAYDNTTCIHGNTTFNHTFYLKGNSFYYFALSHVTDVSLKVSASGEISQYYIHNMSSLETTSCNGDNSPCHIPISNYDMEKLDKNVWSLYVTSNSTMQNTLKLNEVRVSWTILGVSLLLVGFLWKVVVGFCVCIHCCVSRKKKSDYRPLPTVEHTTREKSPDTITIINA